MVTAMPYLLIWYPLSRPAPQEALIVLLPPWGKAGKGVIKIRNKNK
jgi:hypothetical protein